MQPAYGALCVPPGHVVVVIVKVPPGDVRVTFAVAVAEPELLIAVSV